MRTVHSKLQHGATVASKLVCFFAYFASLSQSIWFLELMNACRVSLAGPILYQDLKQSVYGDASKAFPVLLWALWSYCGPNDLFSFESNRCLLVSVLDVMDAWWRRVLKSMVYGELWRTAWKSHWMWLESTGPQSFVAGLWQPCLGRANILQAAHSVTSFVPLICLFTDVKSRLHPFIPNRHIWGATPKLSCGRRKLVDSALSQVCLGDCKL